MIFTVLSAAPVVVLATKSIRIEEAEKIRKQRKAERAAELNVIGARLARMDLMAEMATLRVKPCNICMYYKGERVSADDITAAEAAGMKRRGDRLKDKRGRRLTARQKKAVAVADCRINPALWLCVESNTSYFVIRHRYRQDQNNCVLSEVAIMEIILTVISALLCVCFIFGLINCLRRK